MYTNFSLEEVIAAVDVFLVKSGLSDYTISRYRRFGFNYYRDGFSAEGCNFYSEDLAESLVVKFTKVFHSSRGFSPLMKPLRLPCWRFQN